MADKTLFEKIADGDIPADLVYQDDRAVAFRDVAGDVLADDLVDVARDLADDAVTPGSLQVLRFALIELAADGAIDQAGRAAARDQLLHEWTVLYADYPVG